MGYPGSCTTCLLIVLQDAGKLKVYFSAEDIQLSTNETVIRAIPALIFY